MTPECSIRARCSGPPGGAVSRGHHRGGIGQRGKLEFRRYLDVSLESLSEVSYTLTLRLARDRGILRGEESDKVDKLRQHAGAVTWRLYDAVAQKGGKTQTPEP